MNFTRLFHKLKREICLIIVCCITFFSLQSHAGTDTEQSLIGKVLRVYDGDTIFVTLANVHPVFGSNLGIRLNSIDTPELDGNCAQEKDLAKKAKERVAALLPAGTEVKLVNLKRDKYFRILADVYTHEIISVNNTLLMEKLAQPYTGGIKINWCEEVLNQ